MELFEYDGHPLIWGDAMRALSCKIPDNSIDLIFADPPYNIGKNFNGTKHRWKSDDAYLQWCYEWLDLCIQKLVSNGSMYLMAATQNMPYLDIYIREKVHILSRIVWYYDSSGVQARKHFGSLYEPILFCVKEKDNYTFNSDKILVEAKTGAKRHLIDYRKAVPTQYNIKKVPGNVWEFPRVRYRMKEYETHPTQKPEALLERIIYASSNPGDLVLDPFAGTFTASFVAKKLGRRSIGVEIEEEYIKIGLRRLRIQTQYTDNQLTQETRSYERPHYQDGQLRLFERR